MVTRRLEFEFLCLPHMGCETSDIAGTSLGVNLWQVFGLVVKTSLRLSAAHIRAPRLHSSLLSRFQLPAHVPGMQQVMV